MSSTCRARTSTSTWRGSSASRSRRSRRCPTRSSRAGPARRFALAPALRGARTLVEARDVGRAEIHEPPGPRRARRDGAGSTLERFRELREPAHGELDRGGGAGDRARAQGGRRRPASVAARADRRESGPELWAVLVALPARRRLPCGRQRSERPRSRIRSSVRLYSSLTRRLEELPPPPGPVRMYFCGPTVYQRIHVGNARPFVLSMWLKRWLARQGYDVVARREHHRHQRQDLRRGRAGMPSAELAAAGVGVVRRGHRRARARPARPRAEGIRDRRRRSSR